MKHSLYQLMRFGVVGASNTAIDLTIFFLLTRFISFFTEMYLAAAFISFVVAVINAYIWNRRWTFKRGTGVQGQQLFWFFLLQSGILGLNLLLLWVFVEAGVYDVAAKLLAAVVAGTLNFVLQKFLIFHKNSV